MSYYVEDPKSCRVDFFKPSGKWYTTESIIFDGYNTPLIHDAFKEALRKDDHIKNHYFGMQAVCLEPYHKNSHPISLIWNG